MLCCVSLCAHPHVKRCIRTDKTRRLSLSSFVLPDTRRLQGDRLPAQIFGLVVRYFYPHPFPAPHAGAHMHTEASKVGNVDQPALK